MKGKFEKLISSKTPVIVYWYSDDGWGFDLDDEDDDINEQLEVFDRLKDSLNDKIRIIKININSGVNRELANSRKIRKSPLLQIFKDSEEIFRSKTYNGFSVLMDMVLDCYSTGEKFIED